MPHRIQTNSCNPAITRALSETSPTTAQRFLLKFHRRHNTHTPDRPKLIYCIYMLSFTLYASIRRSCCGDWVPYLVYVTIIPHSAARRKLAERQHWSSRAACELPLEWYSITHWSLIRVTQHKEEA